MKTFKKLNIFENWISENRISRRIRGAAREFFKKKSNKLEKYFWNRPGTRTEPNRTGLGTNRSEPNRTAALLSFAETFKLSG